MSIKIMSKVWEHSSHEGSPLLLLLALADHASDDGVCWPGIPRLAHKTRKTERHTKRLLVKLEKSGEVYIAREVGRGNTNMYYITLGFSEEKMVHTLIKRFEFEPDKASQIAKQIIEFQIKGDTQDTFSSDEEDEKGDIQGQEKVTPGAEKVTPRDGKGDKAMSPESSSTVIKPSVRNRQKDSVFPEKPKERTDDEKTDNDCPAGRARRNGVLDVCDGKPIRMDSKASALPVGLGVGDNHTPDPIVEAIIEQTETHPGPCDLGRISEAAQAAAGNHAVPAQAGGDDGFLRGPVDAFCQVLAGILPDQLPKKQRKSWGLKLCEIARAWSTDELTVTPQIMEVSIRAIPDDENVGWRSFSSPYSDNFDKHIGPLLLNSGKPRQKGVKHGNSHQRNRGRIAQGAVRREVASEKEARAILGDKYRGP